MTDASRDLGAVSGLPVGAAAGGSLAQATLLSLVRTADGKREATDVTLHRDIFLVGGPRGVAHPAGRMSGLVVTGVVGVLLGRSGRVGQESP